MRARVAVALLLVLGACKTAVPPRKGEPYQTGLASYYHDSLAGNKTANGERYDPSDATCAHRSLPFGTRVEVRLVKERKRVVCRINDRGPFVSGRVIDLSRAAAEELGITTRGVAKVELRVLD